jgi:hypothetical protein
LFDARLRAFGVGDPAKFCEHNKLSPMRVAIQRQDATTRSATVKQLLYIDSDAIALAYLLRVAIVIMKANNVGCTTFPAVITNNRSCCIQRLTQVIEGFDSIPVLAYTG